jgi:hypothetical protein
LKERRIVIHCTKLVVVLRFGGPNGAEWIKKQEEQKQKKNKATHSTKNRDKATHPEVSILIDRSKKRDIMLGL